MTKNTKKTTLARKGRAKSRARMVVQPRVAKEVGILGKALRGLGGLGGSALGGMFGMAAPGAAAGSSLGAAVSKWLGAGDYSVSENSIVDKTLRGSAGIPDMHKNDQSVVIRHKEYLGEVRSNTTFTVNNSYALNPGVQTTFPWLYRIATRFQEYRIRGMVFHYVPSSGSAIASTNNALGTVMMQTSYRSNDSAPTSKVEMLNEYWSSEAVPSEAFCHPIECNPAENPFNIQYVRSGPVPSGDNQLIYDLGVTHLAVSGQQAANIVLGDLWVSYEIELKKPLIDSNVTDDVQWLSIDYTSPVGATWFATPSTNVGNLALTTDGVRALTFPKGSQGTWLITYRFIATTVFTSGNLGAAPTLTNCVAYGGLDPFVGSSTVGTQVPSSGTSDMAQSVMITITDPAAQAVVAFPNQSVVGTAARGNLIVSRVA